MWKLGLAAVVGLVLVGGSLFAQWIDPSDGDSLPDGRSTISLTTAVITEEAKLLASDGMEFNQFGIFVAISGDTAIVGAPFANGGTGAAYVFVRSGTCGAAWCEEAKLLASDGAVGDQFGFSVAVSANTAVVGVDFDDDRGPNSGSAYVFVRGGTCGSTWCEQAKLLASDGAALDAFGYSVAVSNDTAFVGAVADDDNGPGSGSAYVFVRGGTCGSTWCEEAKLLPSDGVTRDFFGTSMAIRGDTAVVGSEGDDDNGENSGSAYVFVRGGTCGSTWCEEAKLLASDRTGDSHFGLSVAVSGGMAVVGAPYGDRGIGAAYVFVRGGKCGSAWCEQAKLLAGDGEEVDYFGYSVAVSGDTAVVAAVLDDDNDDGSGSAYVFVRGGTCGSTWCEQAKLLASDGAFGDLFGISLAVCHDTALVGAFRDDDHRGSAYIFRVPAGDCDPCFRWKNHGEYVGCVSSAVSAQVECGAITEKEGDALLSSTARSDVGKEGFLLPECTP